MVSSKQLLHLLKKFDEVVTQMFDSVLPYYAYINLTISSGTTIYRAYNNNDIQMVVFIIFVFFGSFLLDYFFRVHYALPRWEKSAKKRNAKIGIWVLLSTIMLGFAFEFSSLKYLTESLCLFGVVIGGNALLFYVYFIREGNKSGRPCSVEDSCCCNIGDEDENEYKLLIEAEGEDKV
ncbi:hypothetical protein RIF29_18952 [Crotalaria pallida]|uniref:Uncharacterized protein n=1 Tax=Crotalaria pallida TaxID=3830 RepID=A0AAN9EYL7_CROPI